MKKVVALVVAMVMVIGLSACGNKAPEGQVADLFDAGYEVYMSSGGDSELNVMLYNGSDSYITVTVPAKQSEIDEFFAMDCGASDYNDKVCELLSSQKSVTIEDVSDVIPSEDELNEYIGKTVGELYDMGFMGWGSSWGGSGEFDLTFDNNLINITCYFDEKSDKDVTEMSEDELADFVVSDVVCNGISSCYFQ